MGSIVMDFIAYCERRPEPGETVIGSSYAVVPGGKGFNQAVAASRAGAEVSMVGAVGEDQFGELLMANLAAEDISSALVRRVSGTPTGAGFPLVTSDGSNSIVIVPGVGEIIDVEYIESVSSTFAAFDIVVLQLELSPSVAIAVSRACADVGTRVLLNPAPARGYSEELLSLVDFLVPNEVEAELLAGERDPEMAAVALSRSMGGLPVVVTCGAAGAVAVEDGRVTWHPAAKVDRVVDTVGAGDVFCGYLAAGVANGDRFQDAVAAGVAAASHSVTQLGGALSAPHRSIVESTF